MKIPLSRRSFLKAAASAVALAPGRGTARLGSALGAEVEEAARGEPRFEPRFAICNETFEGWPFEKACGFAAECGYRGIEIAPFTLAASVTDVTAERRKELRRRAEKHGLEVAGSSITEYQVQEGGQE